MEAKQAFAAEDFKQQGFMVIKDVYDPQELLEIKQLFKDAFKDGLYKEAPFSSSTIINDIYRYFPGIVDVIINKKYIEALRKILGEELVWLPECAVHHNRYFQWHKDTTHQEMGGVTSHRDTDHLLVQCATYFQPNTVHGGGVTIIPGSQHTEDEFVSLYTNRLSVRLKNRVRKLLKTSAFDKADRHPLCIDLPSETGDLVVFDLRMDHRSTGLYLPESRRAEKYAVFNTFGTLNQVTQDYVAYMKTRQTPYYQYLRSTTFADELYRKARELGVRIVY